MKLSLLCLAFPFTVAVAIDIVILVARHQGMLDPLVRGTLDGIVVGLSRRPP